MNRDRGDKTKHSDDISDTDNVSNIFRRWIITISLLRQDDRQLTQSGEWSDQYHTHYIGRVHAHWPVDRARLVPRWVVGVHVYWHWWSECVTTWVYRDTRRVCCLCPRVPSPHSGSPLVTTDHCIPCVTGLNTLTHTCHTFPPKFLTTRSCDSGKVPTPFLSFYPQIFSQINQMFYD